MSVKLQKMTFSTVYPKLDEFYNVLSANRARLKPWFWWADEKVTPNKVRFSLFIFLYLLDTKRKEFAHKFNFKKLYDEQFIIMVNGKFAGMTGLDNINDITKDAEMWRFVSKENEGFGIGSASVKFLEEYSLESKQLKRLYAKINTENTRSIQCVKRNGFTLKTIEYGIPTSCRNPKIADIMTWEKQLVK